MKVVVNALMKEESESSAYYDIRSYKLVNETSYIHDKTYTIDINELECDDTVYVYVWLHNDNKNIPFPDESLEHFENKQLEYNLLRIWSLHYRKKINEACNKIISKLNNQLRREEQRKKELICKLSHVCNLEDIKYNRIWELENAPTITRKLLDSHIEEIKMRNWQERVEII
jgi:hypothetical protein